MIRDKIIIVEDDPGISKYLQAALRSHGYDILLAPDGKTALEMIASHCPDVLLLDLGLPDMDGSEIIRSVRTWSRMPIIIISARSAEIDKAAALDMGADDYLTKPFGTVELLARIRTALRHTRTDGTSDGLAMTGEYRVGDLCIDYNKHRVFLAGEDTHLTPNEYKIVALLGRHAGQVLTYKSMMKELWGPASAGTTSFCVCTWRTSAARSSRTRSSRSTFSPRSASATAWPTATESLSRTKSSRSSAPGAFLQFAAAQSAVIVTVREMDFAMSLPPKI